MDLGGTSDKNLLDILAKSIQKLIKLITETNSNLRNLKTYDKTINNLISRHRWQKAINEKL